MKRILLLGHCPRIDFALNLAALFADRGMRVLTVDATERQKYQWLSFGERSADVPEERYSTTLVRAVSSEQQLAQRVALPSYDIVLVDSDRLDVVHTWHSFDHCVVVTDLERETIVKTMGLLAACRASGTDVALVAPDRVHVHFHPVCAVQANYVRYLAEQAGFAGAVFYSVPISAHDEALRYEMLYGLPDCRAHWSAAYRQTLQQVMNRVMNRTKGLERI